MTVSSFPSSIRPAIRASKTRRQAAAFSASSKNAGRLYVQATGPDTPVIWDIEFRLTGVEAAALQQWFIFEINRGIDEFMMPIRTEFGLIMHKCRFLPEGLMDATEDGQSWVYRARIMARAQVIPTVYSDAADLIVALPDWPQWGSLLDQAINSEWPA